jgi:predicted AAA+ superfamily ATPase
LESAENLARLAGSLESLVVYRNVLNDKVMRKFIAAARTDGADAGAALCGAAAELIAAGERLGIAGDLFRGYAARLLVDDENPFSLAAERGSVRESASVRKLALADMRRMLDVMSFDAAGIFRARGLGGDPLSYNPAAPKPDADAEAVAGAKTPEEALGALEARYKSAGCGVIGRFRAAVFDGKRLVGAENPDGVMFPDIIGYEEQKRLIRENTEAFLNGAPANNVLLFGARGTGKSSCIKALYNEYGARGLRVVEVAKERLVKLPVLAGLLENRGAKFIIFIDDLSFGEFEAGYKHMKSLIEGGVGRRPDNALFYATSNRRHIVAEKWSDRGGSVIEDGEAHASDAVNEKLALSDRFGLTVTFDKPSPQAYMDIVRGLLKRAGISIPEDEAAVLARRWELTHHGLSGRSARQFVDSFKACRNSPPAIARPRCLNRSD